jgi:hypothetical protein
MKAEPAVVVGENFVLTSHARSPSLSSSTTAADTPQTIGTQTLVADGTCEVCPTVGVGGVAPREDSGAKEGTSAPS